MIDREAGGVRFTGLDTATKSAIWKSEFGCLPLTHAHETSLSWIEAWRRIARQIRSS